MIGKVTLTTAQKKAVDILVGKLVSSLEKRVQKKEVSELRRHLDAEELWRKAQNIRQVKAILNLDRPTDLMEFYHPGKISARRKHGVTPGELRSIRPRGLVLALGPAPSRGRGPRRLGVTLEHSACY